MRYKMIVRVLCSLVSLTVALLFLIAPSTSLAAKSRLGQDWVVTLDASQDIFGLFALNKTHVWAVGSAGAIYFFNGTRWHQQDSARTTVPLNSVWAYDATHVWAVGGGNTILRYDGTSWSKQFEDTLQYGDLTALSGVSSTNIWAVGNYTQIYHYDGISWTKFSHGLVGTLHDVSAFADDWVWAVGSNDCVARFDGTIWQPDQWDNGIPYLSSTLWGVHAIDRTHVWLLGAGMNPQFYNGSTWKEVPAGATPIGGCHAASAGVNNVWFATPGGMYHWNGSSLSLAGLTGDSSAVTVAPTGEVWAVNHAFNVVTQGQQLDVTSTYYLAEGCTDYGFDTLVLIENPNDSRVDVRVTFMTDKSPVQMQPANIDSMTTVAFDPKDILGAANFSTKIECLSGKSIAVERWMAWPDQTGQFSEGHSSIGVTAPSKTWYLAEGSSKWGFECWVLVQNPNSTEATVDLTYMIEGVGPKVVKKAVPANSRRTFFMADDIGSVDASVKVSGNVPVIAERAMYRNGRREGHGSIGTTAPAKDYYLAEGTTDWGFTTYVLVQNPNPAPNQVTLTYMTQAGPIQEPAFTMPANSRKTIRVNDLHPGKDLSTKVHGSKPLIAERAMYWDSGYGEVCHDSIGLSAPHSTFYLPGGVCEPLNYELQQPDIETYTLVQNPNNKAVQVRLTYIDENLPVTVTVPANSRKTFCMSDYFGVEPTDSGIVVESLTSGCKIMAENANYIMQRTIGQETIGAYADESGTVLTSKRGRSGGTRLNLLKAKWAKYWSGPLFRR